MSLVVQAGQPDSSPDMPSGQADRKTSGLLSAAGYPSIQQALDANPGKMLYLPAADYVIEQPGKGRDERAGEGPRYQYAVRVAGEARNIHFANNILAPGIEGVSNIELKP